jgi:lipopolysaccharide transport system permease protein
MSSPPAAVTRIEPSPSWGRVDLAAVWQYRELLLILVQRDLKVRYRQTVLGLIWVILQPLIPALIFAVIFGRLASLPSGGAPYILFAYAGLLVWNFFGGIVTRASNSLVGQAGLLTKVYFPRLVIPFSSALGGIADFAVPLTFTFVLMGFFRYLPSWQIVGLAVFLPLTLLLATGIALWVSALNVRYRDFAFIIPFMMQAWMYASPVAYSSDLVPERWRTLYALNPMVAAIEGVRASLLGGAFPAPEVIGISASVALIVFTSGLFFFRRVERTFADYV